MEVVACTDGDRDMTGQKGLRDDMIGDVWIIRYGWSDKGRAVTVKWKGDAEMVRQRRWAKMVLWDELWMDREGRFG